MRVTYVEENEDGSATMQLDDISAEELRLLVQEGLIAVLKRAAEEEQLKSKYKEE